MVSVVVFEFSSMRCQPLRRALYAYRNCPQEGLSTRSVSSPIEPRWFRLLCLSLVVCVASPLGGRYMLIGIVS